jgi:hypothetical protein
MISVWSEVCVGWCCHGGLCAACQQAINKHIYTHKERTAVFAVHFSPVRDACVRYVTDADFVEAVQLAVNAVCA